MGRRLDVLLGRTTKQTARLKALLGLASRRLAVLRAHRQVRCDQARGDAEQLLRLGHPDRALLRAEQVVREGNAIDALVVLEGYCGLITERAALVDATSGCPEELREAAAGLVYAAARCGEVPELQEVRALLAAKIGRGFVAEAAELRSGCGVNAKIVQKLSTKQPSLESRQMVLQEIAAEKGIAVRVHEPAPCEDSSRGSNQRKTKQDDETITVDIEEGMSDDSAERYEDVEAAAQAAFRSAASAAAAAKAAVELSRGGAGDRRKPGSRVQVDKAKEEEESVDGKKSERTGHFRNHSSEIEEDEANLGSVKENNLKDHHQRDQQRGRPASVRTKRGF